MKFKHFVTFVALLIIMSAIPSAFASGDVTPDEAVEIMCEYGFLKGTDQGLELDRTPTRMEAIIMAVRIRTGGWEALEDLWQNPRDWDADAHNFTDVTGLEYKYVTSAIQSNGPVYISLTNGISETEFGPDLPVTAEQYVTMLLRALNYDDSFGNFSLGDPWELSDRIGLTDGSYPKTESFTRRDMVYLAYRALRTNVRNNSQNMYYYYFIFQREPGRPFPEVFQSNNVGINTHYLSCNRMVEVGETAHAGFGTSVTEERLFDVEISDLSVINVDEIRATPHRAKK